MGIEFRSPDDKGWNPYGKKHQTYLSGWGCIIYPIVVILITVVCILLDINFLQIVIGIMIFIFVITMISIFYSDSD